MADFTSGPNKDAEKICVHDPGFRRCTEKGEGGVSSRSRDVATSASSDPLTQTLFPPAQNNGRHFLPSWISFVVIWPVQHGWHQLILQCCEAAHIIQKRSVFQHVNIGNANLSLEVVMPLKIVGLRTAANFLCSIITLSLILDTSVVQVKSKTKQ